MEGAWPPQAAWAVHRHHITACIADENVTLLENLWFRSKDLFLSEWDSCCCIATMVQGRAGSQTYVEKRKPHFAAIPHPPSSQPAAFQSSSKLCTFFCLHRTCIFSLVTSYLNLLSTIQGTALRNRRFSKGRKLHSRAPPLGQTSTAKLWLRCRSVQQNTIPPQVEGSGMFWKESRADRSTKA